MASTKIKKNKVYGGWNEKTNKWTPIDATKTLDENAGMLYVLLDALAAGFVSGALSSANSNDAFKGDGWEVFLNELANYDFRITDYWWINIFEPFVEESGSNYEIADNMRSVVLYQEDE